MVSACQSVTSSLPSSTPIYPAENRLILTISTFIEEILLHSRLTIPEGSSLIIKHTIVTQSRIDWERDFKNTDLALSAFTLNKILLPFGKTVILSTHSYEQKEDQLEIFADSKNVVIQRNKAPSLIVDLYTLYVQMLISRRNSITIRPNQQLIFHGISLEERVEIKNWCNAYEIEAKQIGLRHFLFRRLPIGSTWVLKLFFEETSISTANENNLLVLTSSQPIKLSLRGLQTAEKFAISLLLNSSSSLIASFEKKERVGILKFLALTFLYFFCNHPCIHKDKPLPKFLSFQTRIAIQELLKDECFLKHLNYICNNNEILDEFHRMMEFELEEIDQPNFKAEASVAFVLNTMMKIIKLELNTDFLKKAQTVCNPFLPMY